MLTKTLLIGAVVIVVILMVSAFVFLLIQMNKPPEPVKNECMDVQKIALGERIKFPAPRSTSNTSVEEALMKRRSVRAYSGRNVTIQEVSQLLWAAQGITAPWGGRTAPSAGALYPLELYVVVGDVDGLDKGVYKYKPEGHELEKVADGDKRRELSNAALNQECIRNAAIDIVFTAVYERTTWKYKERGIRYVQIEAGHAAQNVYLQAVSLDLGTVVIGAFFDDMVKEVMHAGDDEEPLYIMPVGKKG
jgi:SagB-type dehydrogenase family enzyme